MAIFYLPIIFLRECISGMAKICFFGGGFFWGGVFFLGGGEVMANFRGVVRGVGGSGKICEKKRKSLNLAKNCFKGV